MVKHPCLKWTHIPLLVALATQPLSGQNPIIRDIGMSDPHVRVFGDTVYLYCGHDSSPDDRTWIMKNWRIFSTTDLVNWTLEGTISPGDNYMEDHSTDCWAGDAASRNGHYYFYFSDRKRSIGVMASGSPQGPFHDALGKPLVTPMHDPTILIDNDPQETPYLIYGDKEGGGYHIARLNDDMTSLAEDPVPLTINGELWDEAPAWMDKNYVFKYHDMFYLSWGRDYAVSDNVYGPYQCAGSVGHGHHLNEFAHGSFFWWKDQFYHIWCYYLRNGYKYRESVITYCHFDDSGAIVTDTDFLDRHFATGVGRYDASWPEIQAEWYYEVSRGIEKQGSRTGGFVLAGIPDGGWVRYANVNFRKKPKRFEARVTSTGGNGKIGIRADHPAGPLLGSVTTVSSAPRNADQIVSCNLDAVKGRKDIYLTFSSDENCTFTLDWFRFVR